MNQPQIYSKLILLFAVSLFYSCSSEVEEKSNSVSIVENPETVDSIINNILPVESNKPFEGKKVVAQSKEEILAGKKRKENIAKQIKESEIVKKIGTDCSVILEKYKSVTAKFIDSGDESDLDSILSWDNDPIFISCRNNTEFKEEFEKTAALLED